MLAALAVAGCGDDDDGDGGNTQGGLTAGQQDAEAKANARELATVVEACFVDRQDYSGCRGAEGSDDVGEARVENSSATGYTIVSPSESGNAFRLEKTEDGTLVRTCTTAGKGGCSPSGTW